MNDMDEDAPRIKRFKHQSYNQTLKEVHLPSALDQSQIHEDIGDNESHFHESLEHWRQLNLATSFIQFANKAGPLSASMPLLLHNWKEIVDLWIVQLNVADDEGLRALLDLLQKMAHDLRTTLSPVYTDLLTRLLALLPKAISAPALTALLSTFSSLFRYLLVPSINPELLAQSWSSIRATLPKCLPEIQRAMAEVWGSLLRRLKSSSREQAVQLVVQDIKGIEEAVAWIFVFACKSVSQTLHTASQSIIKPFLAYYLVCDNPEGLFVALRRTFTALIHHVKTPDQFSPIGDLLVHQFSTTLQQLTLDETKYEPFKRCLEVLFVPCSVRQGSRLTKPQLTSLFNLLSSIPIHDERIHASLLKFLTALYMASASDMSIWLGPGYKFLQRVWATPESMGLAVRLAGTLAEGNWSGFKMVLLPLVLEGTGRVVGGGGEVAVDGEMERERESGREEEGDRRREMIKLLAELRRGKRLSRADVDMVWKNKVEGLVLERMDILGQGKFEDSAVLELEDIFTLSTFFSPAFTKSIIVLIERILFTPSPPHHLGDNDTEEKHPQTQTQTQTQRREQNMGWVLGLALHALVKRDSSEWGGEEEEEVDLTKWTKCCISRRCWADSYEVLNGLVVLSQSPDIAFDPIVFERGNLSSSLISHSHPLRLATLRFLLSDLVKTPITTTTTTTTSGTSIHEIVKRCLQGEEVPLDVQGVRERVLRIGRVSQVVKEGDEEAAEVCARWLIAQLKVNLRPLWSPAAGALSSLSQRFGDLVWRLVFGELKALAGVYGGDEGKTSGSGRESGGRVGGKDQDEDEEEGNEGEEEEEEEEVMEEERSWRDPSAHLLRVAIAKWASDRSVREYRQKVRQSQGRFDVQSYETQLLMTLCECHEIAEKHNRELVPFFLHLIGQDGSSPLTTTTTGNNNLANDNANSIIITTVTSSRKQQQPLPRHKLTSYLTLFSKFTNPNALYMTSTLRALYTSWLSHPDRGLQMVSLKCLMAYKTPWLVPHQEKMRALLDDVRFRDELVSLDFGGLMEEVGGGGGGGGEDEDGEDEDGGQRGKGRGRRQDVVEIYVRILYGLLLEKKGRARGGGDRRAAVLSVLGGCTEAELGILVDLMLAPLGARKEDHRQELFALRTWEGEAFWGERQKVGFLVMLGDVVKNLGTKLVRYWPALVGTTIDLLNDAQGKLAVAAAATSSVMVGDQGDEAEEDEEDEQQNESEEQEGEGEDKPTNNRPSSSKALRTIRQLGLKRLAEFFRLPVAFDFTPFMPLAFSSFISPRLPALDTENIQAPSGLLELFHVWTLTGEHTTFLVDYDRSVLPKIYACLVATNVKPTVISKIFDIVEKILEYAPSDPVISERVVVPHVSLLLANISTLVERTKGVASVASPLAQRQIGILSQIAHYSTDSKQANTLLTLFSPLLRKPAKLVPEKVKVDLLNIVAQLMHLMPDLKDSTTPAYDTVYGLLSQLFQSLRYRATRVALVSAFNVLASLDGGLQKLAELLSALNAFSTKRMDEPDFDKRLGAFVELNERLYLTLSASEWVPILYNMLFFIQDPAELAIRNNASFAMKRFVDILAASPPGSPHHTTFQRVLFPGLRNGLRSKVELVRAEILGVIAHAVMKCSTINSELKEMEVLLANGDEEANFFNNILHVQIHRRSRALRRLAEFCDEGCLRSKTLSDIFVPLVGNYIVSTAALDHHLVNDAIVTTGRIARQLAWGPYYALVQKYLKLSRVKDQSEKVYVRVLVAVLDNFHFAMEDSVSAVRDPVEDGDGGDAEEDEEEGEGGKEADDQRAAIEAKEAKTMAKIVDAVNLRLLPTLLGHLEKHDVTTDDNARLPLAIGIVNVAKHLPTSSRQSQITRLVTILSQILRSRSQETRDLTKDALCKISASLGPEYLPLIVKELRAALLRGPQLHVLAFVVHAVLVHVTSPDHVDRFDTLDDIADDVATVSAEVVFGESGKDIESEDFKTKMREVRTSAGKALDSFTVAARFVTPPKISSLLAPLRAIMQETQSVKPMNLVEEVLKRITGGLNNNKHLVPTDLIALCNTLISQNAEFLKEKPIRRKQGKKHDAIVQVHPHLAPNHNHYSHNAYRFVAFGLELFQTALRRNRFDFRDPDVLTRLDAMVPLIGNTLYSGSSAVILGGLKSAAGMIKCPAKSLDSATPVFIKQIITILKDGGNTESEVSQIALKSLATILRDGPAVHVMEKDLVYLLELVSPDLEEPTRQASVFTILKAIVARKFVVPEIYDIMDKVSEIMVTSQSPQVQELCRSVLLQFLLDYPQGKGRLRTQMTFYAQNLSYVHESGRKSVLELLGAVIAKFDVQLIREYADLLFVALVMTLANDDSAKCREMASLIIKNLFVRLDEDQRKLIMTHLHTWSRQHSQPQLSSVSSQVYGLIIDELQTEVQPFVSKILEDLNVAINQSCESLKALGDLEQEEESNMEVDLNWQSPYQALTAISKLVRVFPDLSTRDGALVWSDVIPHLTFPHAWVRAACSRILGLLFTAAPPATPRSDLPNYHPLSVVGTQDIAKKLCYQLKSEHLDEALSLQIVKNLFYLGKCFYAIPPQLKISKSDVDNDEDEDADQTREDKAGGVHSDPLPWMFSKLSYQIKSAHIARRNRSFSPPNWSLQPLSALRWFAAMASYMEPARLEQFLVHILSPLYRLSEDDTIRDAQIVELKTVAAELQDLVQAKVGVSKFSTVYNQIRQSTLGVRQERKTAKSVQMVANPEAAAKRKQQRNVIKKDSRKRKQRGYMEREGKLKRRRED